MKTRELKAKDSRLREQTAVALMKMRLKHRGDPALKFVNRGLAKTTATVSLLLLTLVLSASRAGAVEAIPFDGGGGTSSGGEFEVTGIIGQPDPGPIMTGEDFELSGEFVAMVVTVLTPDGTELTISVSDGNNVVLSWLADGPDFILEQTTDLGAGNWTAVAVAPVNNGTINTVTMPVTTGNRFFRLRSP